MSCGTTHFITFFINWKNMFDAETRIRNYGILLQHTIKLGQWTATFKAFIYH